MGYSMISSVCVQSAALNVCQALAAEVNLGNVDCRSGSGDATPASEEYSLPSLVSNGQRTGAGRYRRRTPLQSPPTSPPAPIINQLTEMGFNRRSVEQAYSFYCEYFLALVLSVDRWVSLNSCHPVNISMVRPCAICVL